MRKSQTSFSLLLLLRQSEKFSATLWWRWSAWVGRWVASWVLRSWMDGKFSIAILWFISFAPKLLYFDSRQTNVRIEIKRKRQKAVAVAAASSQWKTCEKHARLEEVDEGFLRATAAAETPFYAIPNQKLRIRPLLRPQHRLRHNSITATADPHALLG